MASDARQLDQALQHIRRIKAGHYPVIMGNSAEGGGYRILERPWQEVPEMSKLIILQDAVNWSGISNRDQAHILLSEINPGQIPDAQRNQLIHMATKPPSLRERLQASEDRNERQREPGDERGGRSH